MALNKNLALSPSSSGHCGRYDTMYATIGCVLRKACADDTILGVHREPVRNQFGFGKPNSWGPRGENHFWGISAHRTEEVFLGIFLERASPHGRQ